MTAGPDLGVDLAGIRLPNPIVAASGTLGHGDELARLCPPAQLGAVTTKSVAKPSTRPRNTPHMSISRWPSRCATWTSWITT